VPQNHNKNGTAKRRRISGKTAAVNSPQMAAVDSSGGKTAVNQRQSSDAVLIGARNV
jgi:hypothetical protein